MKKNNFFIFIIFILTYFPKKFTISLKIELSKISPNNTNLNSIDEDTEFYPYSFQHSLSSDTSNFSFIFDTVSYISWEESLEAICPFQNEYKYETINNEPIIGCNNTISNFFENQSQPYNYIKVHKNTAEKYQGKIGLNTIKGKNFYSQFNFLNSLDLNDSEKYISFIQLNNKNATMTFGNEDIEDTLKQESSRKCVCNIDSDTKEDKRYAYWCCKISTFRSKNVDIYTDESKSGKSLYAIFSISDEFIIAPKDSGDAIMKYYENLISSVFGVECTNSSVSNIKTLKCPKFTYEELPDLSIVLEDEIGLLAIASDLFKIVGDNQDQVMFKIKVNKLNDNLWYLGEPIIKNYNFLVNYTDGGYSTVMITPSNLNGFILIVITCVGGFLVLFVFLVMIYCISQKEKIDKEEQEIYNYYDHTNKDKEKNKKQYRRFMNKKQKQVTEIINSFNSLDKGFLEESIKEDILAENENEGMQNDNIDNENNNQIQLMDGGAINDENFSQNDEGLLGGPKYELYGTSKGSDININLNNWGEEEYD